MSRVPVPQAKSTIRRLVTWSKSDQSISMSLNSMCASMVAAGMVVYMEPSLFADSTD